MRRARSTRSTARCRESSPPSWPWPSPARPAARQTWPSPSTSPAPAPTPTTSPPPPSASRGSGPAAETSRARSARSTWCRRPAARSPRRDGAGPGLLAESGGGLPLPGRRAGEHRQPDHRPGRPVPVPGGRAAVGAADRRDKGGEPAVTIGGQPGVRAVPARRARGGVPRPGGLRAHARGAGRARRPGQRRTPMDPAMTSHRPGAVSEAEPQLARHLPELLGTGRRGRAVLRGLWRRAGPDHPAPERRPVTWAEKHGR